MRGLQAGYGKKTVLQGVSLRVEEGEVVALLGHNGAGKSTTLKTILGLLPARAGEVRLPGSKWANGDPAENVRRGIALVPQGRGVFPDLTVVENLALGAYTQADRAGASRRIERDSRAVSSARASGAVSASVRLSGGQQQMVAVGTALMQRPRLLMMDEPSIGLAPVLVQRVLRDGGADQSPLRYRDRAGRAEHQDRAQYGAARVRDEIRPHRARATGERDAGFAGFVVGAVLIKVKT